MLRILMSLAVLLLALPALPGAAQAGTPAVPPPPATAQPAPVQQPQKPTEPTARQQAQTKQDMKDVLHQLDTQPADVQGKVRDETQRMLDAGAAMQPGSAFIQLPDTGEVGKAAHQAKVQADLDRMLQGQQPPASIPALAGDTRVPLVFISFSMPDASLKAILHDAALTGAQVMLRGLVNGSLPDTAKRMTGLVPATGKAGADQASADKVDAGTAGKPANDAGMGIDPTLFERLDIREVPVFVLPLEPVQACAGSSGCPAFRHIRITGDVSLAYALEKMGAELGDGPALKTLKAKNQRWLEALQPNQPPGGTP